MIPIDKTFGYKVIDLLKQNKFCIGYFLRKVVVIKAQRVEKKDCFFMFGRLPLNIEPYRSMGYLPSRLQYRSKHFSSASSRSSMRHQTQRNEAGCWPENVSKPAAVIIWTGRGKADNSSPWTRQKKIPAELWTSSLPSDLEQISQWVAILLVGSCYCLFKKTHCKESRVKSSFPRGTGRRKAERHLYLHVPSFKRPEACESLSRRLFILVVNDLDSIKCSLHHATASAT